MFIIILKYPWLYSSQGLTAIKNRAAMAIGPDRPGTHTADFMTKSQDEV